MISFSPMYIEILSTYCCIAAVRTYIKASRKFSVWYSCPGSTEHSPRSRLYHYPAVLESDNSMLSSSNLTYIHDSQTECIRTNHLRPIRYNEYEIAGCLVAKVFRYILWLVLYLVFCTKTTYAYFSRVRLYDHEIRC